MMAGAIHEFRSGMRKIRKANYPLVVKKSPIAGEGVFAVKAIPWGVKIIAYQGAVISNAEAASRAANVAMSHHSFSQINKPRSWL